ncbi:hypothetical protein [Malaciobacter canalis]|uniref:hypothetical protein n=1 Tax=Malaciobacter canalis TaxID=1912871 RepID=UPI00384BE9FC
MHEEYTTVRILPMDKDNEFEEMKIPEVQSSFFLKELPKREDENGSGKYHYINQGLITEDNQTLVLFQYDNRIIACAKLVNIIKFLKPKNGYNGALYFEPSSIKTFDPIDNQQINNMFHNSIKFGQTKHRLDTKYVKDFFAKIKNIKQAPLTTSKWS